MKKCSWCKVEKSESEFNRNKRAKDGLDGRCKQCEHEKYEKNKEKIKAGVAAYRENNREDIKEYLRNRYNLKREEIREESKKRYEERRTEIRQHRKELYLQNIAKFREKSRTYQKARCLRDPLYAAKARFRKITCAAFSRRGYTKNNKTTLLLGASVENVLSMWGIDVVPSGMQIDHIVPLSQAKNIEELEKLCGYRNLQLLGAAENREKSDKKTEENAALCLELLGREWID
jgi:hypothetical protein